MPWEGNSEEIAEVRNAMEVPKGNKMKILPPLRPKFTDFVSPNTTKLDKKIRKMSPTPKSITHRNPTNMFKLRIKPRNPNVSRRNDPKIQRLRGVIERNR